MSPRRRVAHLMFAGLVDGRRLLRSASSVEALLGITVFALLVTGPQCQPSQPASVS